MDMKRRKSAGEALRKERDFSPAVRDGADVLIVVLDREGRIR